MEVKTQNRAKQAFEKPFFDTLHTDLLRALISTLPLSFSDSGRFKSLTIAERASSILEVRDYKSIYVHDLRVFSSISPLPPSSFRYGGGFSCTGQQRCWSRATVLEESDGAAFAISANTKGNMQPSIELVDCARVSAQQGAANHCYLVGIIVY
jgi:hypothetical protein